MIVIDISRELNLITNEKWWPHHERWRFFSVLPSSMINVGGFAIKPGGFTWFNHPEKGTCSQYTI